MNYYFSHIYLIPRHFATPIIRGKINSADNASTAVSFSL
jgi:hypothetical protein